MLSYSPGSTLVYSGTGRTRDSISYLFLKAGCTPLLHKSHHLPPYIITDVVTVTYVFHICQMQRQCFLLENQDVSLTWVTSRITRNWLWGYPVWQNGSSCSDFKSWLSVALHQHDSAAGYSPRLGSTTFYKQWMCFGNTGVETEFSEDFKGTRQTKYLYVLKTITSLISIL